MTALDNLPTLAELHATRRAVSKSDIEPRLSRKAQSDRRFDRAWEKCCKAVEKRDGLICRICGGRCEKTIEMGPRQLQHAHVKRRSQLPKALHHDPRLVFVAHKSCHEDFDQFRIFATQTAKDMVRIEGKPYFNADKPIHFTKVKP